MKPTLNDQPAQEVDLVAVATVPPLGMTSGIVAFEARHPEEDRRVRGWLVGGREGDGSVGEH